VAFFLLYLFDKRGMMEAISLKCYMEDMMKKVKDVMSSHPVTCLADATLEHVAKLMLEYDCGEIPVVDSEKSLNPIGVITDRDICIRTLALGKNPLQLKVRDFMTSPVTVVEVDKPIEACCEIMENKKIRRVPVVDLNGKICGMISLADLATKLDDAITSEVVKHISVPGKPLVA
jgi:CBS domain-containing protein